MPGSRLRAQKAPKTWDVTTEVTRGVSTTVLPHDRLDGPPIAVMAGVITESGDHWGQYVCPGRAEVVTGGDVTSAAP